MPPLSPKYALRYSAQNKTFSLINLFGLVLGMSSCLLIYAFVSFELSMAFIATRIASTGY